MRFFGRDLRSEQSGFTLIEVLVGVVVLGTTALATLQVMVGAVKVNFRTEQTQVAIQQAQAELESIHTLSFEQVALTGPPPATPANGPGSRIAATCAGQGVSDDGCFGLNENGSNLAPLVVEGGNLENGSTVTGGAINPGPTAWSSGDVSGSVYRYVVWQNDYACPESKCAGSQDRKRVVVVVTIDTKASGGERAYREVQSDFIDPDLGKDVEPTPDPAQEVIAQQLFMTDTRCSEEGRSTPTADHSSHNTLGHCSGDNPPDKLSTEPPQTDPAFPAESQPFYDFATDIEPTTGGDADKGLQIRRDDRTGCLYAPAASVPAERTHRWLSDEIEAGSSLVLENDATLSIWSQTLNSAVSNGTICAFLFIREIGAGGQVIDTPIGDAANAGLPYFSYSAAQWPSGEWGQISIPMQLQPPPGETVTTLVPGERLGLAISVESTTATDSLQVLYEHVDHDSRLEIETTTPLP